MKNYLPISIVAAISGMITLGSCTQEVLTDDMTASDSRITVMTRGEGELVASPLRLYIFNSSNQCVAMQALEANATTFTKALPVGTYEVYALGGADDTRYNLPTSDNATKTSAITLNEGQSWGDLMAGSATVTLNNGETNALTLNLSRKVTLINSIVISGVPAATTSVSVKISPLRQSMLLNGTYQGDEGEITIALTKQSDGTTWKMTSTDNYLLPSVDNPTITITVDNTPFTHTCTTPIEANHKINIEGTYQEPTTSPAEITLSGSINGVAWGSNTDVNFTFGPEEATTPSTPTTEIPAAGSIYNTCYVMKVDGNQVTLLSPSQTKVSITTNESQSSISSSINNQLTNWEKDISNNWRVMNYTEAEYLLNNISAINQKEIGQKFNTSKYLLTHEEEIYHFNPNGATLNISKEFASGTNYYLRPVTTITIQ